MMIRLALLAVALLAGCAAPAIQWHNLDPAVAKTVAGDNKIIVDSWCGNTPWGPQRRTLIVSDTGAVKQGGAETDEQCKVKFWTEQPPKPAPAPAKAVGTP